MSHRNAEVSLFTHTHSLFAFSTVPWASRVHHSTAKLLQYVVDQHYETSWSDFSELATVAKTCDCNFAFFILDFKGSQLFYMPERAWRPLELQTCQSFHKLHSHHFLHDWKVYADSCFCLDNSASLGSPSLLPSHFLFTLACPTLPDSCRKPVIRGKKREARKTLVYSGQSWQGSSWSCSGCL